MALFKEVADIQKADTLNLPTPKVVTKNVFVKPSEIQQEMVKDLGERAEDNPYEVGCILRTFKMVA